MRLSFDELVTLAQNTGFDDPNTAAAIALAESGGDPNAYNKEAQDVPGKYGRESADDMLGSYGLWQIYRAAHPEYADQNLNDPQTNANAAFATWQSADGFHPWSTFNNGKYLQYMPSCTA